MEFLERIDIGQSASSLSHIAKRMTRIAKRTSVERLLNLKASLRRKPLLSINLSDMALPMFYKEALLQEDPLNLYRVSTKKLSW